MVRNILKWKKIYHHLIWIWIHLYILLLFQSVGSPILGWVMIRIWRKFSYHEKYTIYLHLQSICWSDDLSSLSIIDSNIFIVACHCRTPLSYWPTAKLEFCVGTKVPDFPLRVDSANYHVCFFVGMRKKNIFWGKCVGTSLNIIFFMGIIGGGSVGQVCDKLKLKYNKHLSLVSLFSKYLLHRLEF